MTLGYDGFMISDHNSYKGCKAWDKLKTDPRYRDFHVIRGIEYDTKDAGHILVIMPDDLYMPILKIRGMRCSKLIKIVHIFGGILGPAHPFGVASSSAMGFKQMDMRLIPVSPLFQTAGQKYLQVSTSCPALPVPTLTSVITLVWPALKLMQIYAATMI